MALAAAADAATLAGGHEGGDAKGKRQTHRDSWDFCLVLTCFFFGLTVLTLLFLLGFAVFFWFDRFDLTIFCLVLTCFFLVDVGLPVFPVFANFW